MALFTQQSYYSQAYSSFKGIINSFSIIIYSDSTKLFQIINGKRYPSGTTATIYEILVFSFTLVLCIFVITYVYIALQELQQHWHIPYDFKQALNVWDYY